MGEEEQVESVVIRVVLTLTSTEVSFEVSEPVLYEERSS